MLLLPVALAPVVLLLLLFSHVDAVASVRQRYHLESVRSSDELADRTRQPSNEIDADAFELAALEDAVHPLNSDGPRECTAVRYSLLETPGSDDSDLLRDVRTAFVPPDYVYASPDCVMAGGADVTTNVEDARYAVDDYDNTDDAYDELSELVEQARRTVDDRGDVRDQSYDDPIEYRQRRDVEVEAVAVNVTAALWDVLKNSANARDRDSERKPVPAVVPSEGSD